MLTSPPIYEKGTVKYNANMATWQRVRAMIPAWKDMQDGDWEGFVVESDEVGSNLEPFLKGMVQHWDNCISDGWPLWFVLQDDMEEAIATLQTMLAAMQRIAPPVLECGITSRFAPPANPARYASAVNAFALRHAARTGEMASADSPVDLHLFEEFINASRVDIEVARALVDDVPHAAGWVADNYAFYLWDLYPGESDWIVVIEDSDAPFCYSLPPLREWPTFAKETS